MRVLIAPAGFKEGLSAESVAQCINRGVRAAQPQARTLISPIVDGGEGFTKALVAASGGTLHSVEVTGPVGRRVEACFGILGGQGPKTAVLEMAAAAGLRLVPGEKRDPLSTTTYGVGELLKAALHSGVERILIGCGDSGTSDGGAGMAQALGARLFDRQGRDLPWGGGPLQRLWEIDLSGLEPGLGQVRIDTACNLNNLLCGKKGVARVFGPQKGASPEGVEKLAASLRHYADVIADRLGIMVHQMPGSGASGGLGAGLHAFLGARLHHWYDIVLPYLNFPQLLEKSDLVITAEGRLDFQTPGGKIPFEIARRAGIHGIPVVALVGSIGQGASLNYEHHIDSFMSILEAPCTLEQAIAQAPQLIQRAAERLMRMLMVGGRLLAITRAVKTPP